MSNDNIERLKNSLNLKTNEALLIYSNVNRLYFSGFNASSAALLIFCEKSYLLVDFRYFEAAKNSVDNIDVVLYSDFFKTLCDILTKNSIKTVFCEQKNISLYMACKFSEQLEKLKIDLIKDLTLDNAIYDLRKIKTESEIYKIKQAQKITEYAFLKSLENIYEGMSEKELALNIEFIMRKNGANTTAFDLITIFAENTSLPHGVPTDKKLKKGDLITMDIGACFEGYCSDMTRTVAFKTISEEKKNVYNIVLKAQQEALKKVSAGVKCSEIDKTARDYIYNQGFEGCFGHATGHSLGLEIHESPSFSSKDDTVLLPGMIMTVEPGIYIENEFGVRIEDMILIKNDSVENLTSVEKELVIL